MANNLATEKSNRPTEFNFFDKFYQTQFPISGQQYDAVYAFFLSRTNNNKDAARSLASSLLEITYETGIDPLSVLDDFKKYNQNESFRTALIALFNSSRRNTSKIGFTTSPSPAPLVSRNIRS
jgi:hypothetical protein